MTVLRDLDLAWEAVNALGGQSEQNNSYDQGFVDAIGKALEAIEKLGGEDAAPKRGALAQRVPDERRAFEKWLPDHLMPSEFSHGFLFQRDEDRYTICFVQDAWDGWMARAALTSTVQQGVEKTEGGASCS